MTNRKWYLLYLTILEGCWTSSKNSIFLITSTKVVKHRKWWSTILWNNWELISKTSKIMVYFWSAHTTVSLQTGSACLSLETISTSIQKYTRFRSHPKSYSKLLEMIISCMLNSEWTIDSFLLENVKRNVHLINSWSF